ncbi:DUF3298 domain-containing protein [Jejudonia soesokkakensis]|uniref:DUF3298 domain-containing protein n=1 Tax=Jejudonia soesokkakensis TaxID=1323432 RepID=A0ABW2MVN5_9FLAO
MNNKLLLLICVFLFLTSCSEKPLIFTSESFSAKDLPMCKDVMCPEVLIDYVMVNGDEEVSEKINHTITRTIINAIYIGEQDASPAATTIPEAVTNFIKEYRLENAEFPAMAVEYFAEASMTKNRTTENVISLQLDHYIFAGGAHGYGATQYLNFDTQTGEELEYDTLILDKTSFTALVEKKFKEAYKIPQRSSINSKGFWFKEDQFYVPNNIGFTNDNLIFSYDEYEIASYAEGRIFFEIPIKEIQQYLSINVD